MAMCHQRVLLVHNVSHLLKHLATFVLAVVRGEANDGCGTGEFTFCTASSFYECKNIQNPKNI